LAAPREQPARRISGKLKRNVAQCVHLLRARRCLRYGNNRPAGRPAGLRAVLWITLKFCGKRVSNRRRPCTYRLRLFGIGKQSRPGCAQSVRELSSVVNYLGPTFAQILPDFALCRVGRGVSLSCPTGG